jgi:hypothetical protein
MAYTFVQQSRQLGCMLAVILLVQAASLGAQTSTVIGTITDKAGKAAVNVLVTIGRDYRYTDVGGRYRIDNVPQGKQRMTIKRGNSVLWQGDVTISGAVATVNQTLP